MKNFIRKIYLRARVPLYIVVNNPCNLNCKYCFGEYNKRSAKDDFSTDELKRLIDELCENGTIYLTVHGGETLMRKDIGEIVRYMKEKGLYVNLITNGILLEKKLHEINIVDSICLSLDGREEGNDYIRGKGTFKAVLRAVDLVKSAGIPLRVQATLTKYTKDDMAFLAQLANDKEFHLEFSLLFASTPDMKNLMMDDQETRKALREIKELKKKGYPIFTSLVTLDLALNWEDYGYTTLTKEDLPPHLKPIPCGYARHKFTIDANGRTFPCFPLNTTFNAYNVKEVGVKKAFEHTVRNNKCVLCPFLTQNDWNYMLSLSPGFLVHQVILNMKELIGRYNRKVK